MIKQHIYSNMNHDIQTKQVTVLLLELLGQWLVLMVTLFTFLSSCVKEFRSFGSKIPTVAQPNLPKTLKEIQTTWRQEDCTWRLFGCHYFNKNGIIIIFMIKIWGNGKFLKGEILDWFGLGWKAHVCISALFFFILFAGRAPATIHWSWTEILGQ